MITGDAKYGGWTERMMYNTLNSSVNLQREHWFYANPLSRDGTEGKKEHHFQGVDSPSIVAAHHSGLRWDDMNCAARQV